MMNSTSPMSQSLESIFYFISNTGIFTSCGQIGDTFPYKNNGNCMCNNPQPISV